MHSGRAYFLTYLVSSKKGSLHDLKMHSCREKHCSKYVKENIKAKTHGHVSCKTRQKVTCSFACTKKIHKVIFIFSKAASK